MNISYLKISGFIFFPSLTCLLAGIWLGLYWAKATTPELIADSSLKNERVSESSAYSISAEDDGLRGFLEEESNTLGERLLHAAVPQNPQEAYQWLMEQKTSMPQDEFAMHYRQIMHTWAEEDPQAAAQFAGATDSLEMKEEIFLSIAKNWAEQDAMAAFEWLASSQTADFSDQLAVNCYAKIMAQYAKDNPTDAAGILDQLQSESIQLRVVGPIVKHLSEQNFNDALHWVLGIDNENTRNIGFNQLMFQLDAEDLGSVWQGLVQNQQKLHPETLANAITHFPEDSFPEVAHNIVQLSSEVQGPVTASFVRSWLESSPDEALAWVESQSAGPVFEAGVAEVFEANVEDRPLVAMTWAARVGDVQRRFDMFNAVVDRASSEQLSAIADNIPLVSISKLQQESLIAKINRRIENENAPLITPF